MSDQEIKPEVKSDPLYQMLRHEDVDSFNNSRDASVKAKNNGRFRAGQTGALILARLNTAHWAVSLRIADWQNRANSPQTSKREPQ